MSIAATVRIDNRNAEGKYRFTLSACGLGRSSLGECRVISTLQFLGHDLIFVSTKPAVGYDECMKKYRVAEHTVYIPSKSHFCGLSSTDGTIDFYLRINALKDAEAIYLDYGAGRAAWFTDETNELRRALRSMKGKFAEVIAADVDPVVMRNTSADRCLIIEGNRVDLPDASIDVIVADYVIEHIPDPQAFAAEITRLLKPGGWFCARTPHKWHYVALAERMIPSMLGGKVLHIAQPGRKEEDVFDKTYKMNTLGDIRAAFAGWEDRSFCRRSDPAYYFGSRALYAVADFMHRVMPVAFSGNLFVYMQKPETP